MEQQAQILETSLSKLKDKKCKFYFLTQDSEGKALASVNVIYQFVKYLTESGFEAYILYEKTEYKGVKEWLGEEYSKLPHASIETGELKVGPQDFVFVPEIYGHVLEQIKDMPCTKVIFCQAYDYILDTLNPGFGWANYGVTKCLTTTETQKEYIKSLFPSIETSVITPAIPEYFKPTEKPKKPIIAVHTRDHRDTLKLIKSFYLQHPQFKWLSFRDMRNLPREEFAETLSECFMSVWVDRNGGFGTFPLESMLCNTPVVGTLPILKPDWMTNENGVWVFDESKLVEVVSTFVKNWLEDSVPETLYTSMEKTVESNSPTKEKEMVLSYFNGLITEKISELENALNKLTPVGENS